jgi:hemolysin activation/secretion protein
VKLLLAAVLAACSPLLGAQTTPVVPDAGSILQQIRPVKPPPPSPTGTGLTIEQGSGVERPPGKPFEVKAIRISGNTLFDTPTLHALVANAEGKGLTLAQLLQVAARITDYYRSEGYPLARAIIRAQVIRDGVVDIEVIEARYGRIDLDNRSRVKDPLLQATLSSLQSGQVVSQAELDHALLLLSDVPGVVVSATLKLGEAVGTSDLLVGVASGPAIVGNVALDNYGDRYTGRARIGGTVNFLNSLRHGDVLSASGLTSGRGLQYGRVAYESLLNGLGTRAGASYSALHYELGGNLEPLNANGTANVASLWAKQPLARRRDFNFYGQIHFDWLELRDHIDAAAIHADRHLNVWTASLAGDARDALLSGAVNTWYVGWTAGRVGFDDAAAQSADAATAGTQGGFSRWNASVTRLQSLSPKNTLYLALSGQRASANLDSSQKMIAGGPYTVRAYDTGAISGDTGYLGTVEFRHDLASSYGQWQAVAFVDGAHVKVNKSAWAAGTNSATLSGAGVGLNWAGPAQWYGRVYLARRIGSTPVLVADTTSTRIWIEIGKGF